MDRNTVGTLLSAWVVVAIATGIGFVVYGSALLATAGVVLVIVGLMSLMPALYYLLPERRSEPKATE